MDIPKRGRGRPKGAKNKATLAGRVSEHVSVASSVASPATTTATTQRAALEADRERLLKRIAENEGNPCPVCQRGGDIKVEASIQTALNAVNRMLLQITGEAAPTDTNLIRSPQWARIKAKVFDCLSKKHPKAWADFLKIEADE